MRMRVNIVMRRMKITNHVLRSVEKLFSRLHTCNEKFEVKLMMRKIYSKNEIQGLISIAEI